MSVLVSGSIAFDHIMNFQGNFKDHILLDKVHMLSVSFLVNSLRKMRGGCGGNIAYSLALLGENPVLLGTAGQDFDQYQAFLVEAGVDLSAVRIIREEFTASCFITTDQASNQFTNFYPGAMNQAHTLHVADFNPERYRMAIISPNDPPAMINHVHECRDLGIPYIYDPGQQVIYFDSETLLDGITGAKCVIGNDYELGTVEKKTGRTPEDLLELAEMVIVTRGGFGSDIYTRDGKYEVPVAKEEAVVDPTGVGDAYRAGVIKGLLNGYTVEQMGRVASLAAAYCVERHGTQEHAYTMEQFIERYNQNFADVPIPQLGATTQIKLPQPSVVNS